MRKLLLSFVSIAASLSLAGCGSSSSSTSTGTPTPVAALSATSLSFTGILAGTTTAAQTITLTNSGTGALSVSGINLGGTNSTNFAVTNNCPASLAIGASCTISTTFSPAPSTTGAAVNYSASITVTTNAANATQTITLTGASVAPTATLSTTGISFSGTPAGTTSAAQTVTLTNNGTASLTITSITPGGTNASNFSLTNGCSTTLAIGASCTLSVTFAPGSNATAGTVDMGNITLVTSANPATQTVSLIGTTTAALVPTAVLSTTAITFPATATNATSAAQTATLFNTGNTTLTITGITLGGANASNFALTKTCGATLAAGASCAISVTFSPGSVIATLPYSGTVSVVTNATPATQTITLTAASSVASQCSTTVPRKAGPTATANYTGSTFTGKVMAGSLPMIGSSVQLYAAGNTGNGLAPTAIGSAITTDTTGAFSISTSYSCPFNLSVLYVVAKGGKPGTNGTANSGAVLLSVLGTCASVTTGSTFTVNEATTVAGAYAMAQFLTAGGKLGGSATNFLGLQLAAASAANLINPKTGVSPGATFPANGIAPTGLINSLADVVNACIVGASATSCTQFYSGVTPGIAAVPTNTLDAVLSLAKNPAQGASLFTLSQASTAYAPGLTAAPTDWTMYVTYSGGGMNGPSGIGVDSAGNVKVASYFSAVSYFSNTGTAAFPTGITGNNLNEAYGLAIDQSDNVWVPDEQTSYGINSGLGAVTVISPAGAGVATYSAGGLNFPVSVAIDTGATNWIVDYGNSHLTVLNASGVPLATNGANGYTTPQFAFPVAVAVDSNCYGYVANQSASTITRVAQDGSSFISYVTGNGASGVAVDAGNNVWVANYYGNSVGLLASNGTIVSSGFTGGGVSHPQGIAIDGAGNVWIANYRGPSLTELAGITATVPGTALSPAVGFGPDAGLLEAFGLAIDPSGNIWVSNFGSNTITEFVGMAAPVKTPLLGAVAQP